MDLTLRFPAHPSEEVLEAYAFKRLPEAQVSEVEMHLLACEDCQRTLADIDAFIAAMKTVPAPPVRVPAAPEWGRLAVGSIRRWQWALAASLVLGGIFFFWDSGVSPVPATIVLTSMRGSEAAPATAPANAPLNLTISSTQLDDPVGFRIEIVTGAGDPAWGGPVTRSSDGKPTAFVKKRMSAGTYWVRLYSPDNRLLQEYGLRLN